MNETEIRRRELLRQTRKMYNERPDVPAVHPRYSRIYHSLYGKDSTDKKPGSEAEGSFYLRLVVSILCFICFVYADQSQARIADVNTGEFVDRIGQDEDFRAAGADLLQLLSEKF